MIDGVDLKISQLPTVSVLAGNNGNLFSCCSGRLKTTGGYVFRYHKANP